MCKKNIIIIEQVKDFTIQIVILQFFATLQKATQNKIKIGNAENSIF